MLRVGITGQSGFIGNCLYSRLGLHDVEFERIPFESSFFRDETMLRGFVRQCDVIVHLASMMRCDEPDVVYKTNIALVNKLVSAMEKEGCTPHVIFSSSIQENNGSEYGRSKYDGRVLLEEWAKRNGAKFTGILIPNAFGPYCEPNKYSFVATFCYNLTHEVQSNILIDKTISLVYIENVTKYIVNVMRDKHIDSKITLDKIPWDFEMKVSEVFHLLEYFKKSYLDEGIAPEINNVNEANLFDTFKFYVDIK